MTHENGSGKPNRGAILTEDWYVTALIANVILAHVVGVLVLLAVSKGLETIDHAVISPPHGTEFFQGRLSAAVFFDAFDVFIILAFFPFAVRALVKIWKHTDA